MNQREPVLFDDRMVMVNVSQTWKEGMSDEQLYESARGVWVIGPRREEVDYVAAVHNGIIREVFRVDRWQPAGTTVYRTREIEPDYLENRWEFEGAVAEEGIRQKYVNKDVHDLMNQNPVRYPPKPVGE